MSRKKIKKILSLFVPSFSLIFRIFSPLRVKFIDGEKSKIGKTKIRFTPPLFRGIEYDRIGWIVAIVIEYGGKKILHSFDPQGPAIEDYAEWVIEENPNILFLDAPRHIFLVIQSTA